MKGRIQNTDGLLRMNFLLQAATTILLSVEQSGALVEKRNEDLQVARALSSFYGHTMQQVSRKLVIRMHDIHFLIYFEIRLFIQLF